MAITKEALMHNNTQTRAAMVEQIAKRIADCDFETIDEVADQIYMAVTNNTLLIVANVAEAQDL